MKAFTRPHHWAAFAVAILILLGLIFPLALLLPSVCAVLGLMLCVIFAAAIFGVTVFEGEAERALVNLGEVQPGAFDSVPNALLTLVGVLIGENWHELMYNEVNAKHSLYWAVYFIAYVLIVALLLANLFVGVVLDSMVSFVSIVEETRMQHLARYGANLAELSELEAYDQLHGMSSLSPKGDAICRPSLLTSPAHTTLASGLGEMDDREEIVRDVRQPRRPPEGRNGGNRVSTFNHPPSRLLPSLSRGNLNAKSSDVSNRASRWRATSIVVDTAYSRTSYRTREPCASTPLRTSRAPSPNYITSGDSLCTGKI